MRRLILQVLAVGGLAFLAGAAVQWIAGGRADHSADAGNMVGPGTP